MRQTVDSIVKEDQLINLLLDLSKFEFLMKELLNGIVLKKNKMWSALTIWQRSPSFLQVTETGAASILIRIFLSISNGYPKLSQSSSTNIRLRLDARSKS